MLEKSEKKERKRGKEKERGRMRRWVEKYILEVSDGDSDSNGTGQREKISKWNPLC